MYLLTHSLSPVLLLVVVMKPKELKTKISHADPLTLPPRCYNRLQMTLSPLHPSTFSASSVLSSEVCRHLMLSSRVVSFGQCCQSMWLSVKIVHACR